MLLEKRWEEFLEWYRSERGAVRVVMSLLYDDALLARMRAVEALGRVGGMLAQTDMESVRGIIRRLFWGMNDESGNLIRSAPEAIGEILFNTPVLITEYGRVLGSFCVEEPFERGTHLALARLALLKPVFLNEMKETLCQSLDDEDAAIRGCAAYVLKSLNDGESVEKLREMEMDGEEFDYYDFRTGEIRLISVATMMGK